MNATRKAGLALAAVSTALWLFFLAAILATAPEDGANIGAGLVALLALPLSVGASVTLLASLRAERLPTRSGDAAGQAHPPLDRAAAVLSVVSVVALVAFLLIDPYAASDTAKIGALVTGVGALVVSSALFALPRRPPA